MRRLLFPILFFAFLFWPVVRTQTQQAKILPLAEALLKARFNQIDTLIFHKQIDSALICLDTMLVVFQDAENWKSYQEAVAKYATALDSKKNYEAIHLKVSEALETLDEADMADSLICAKLWSWLAINHRRMNNFVDALSSYQQAIQLYENNHYRGHELAFAYKNAAQIYLRFSENRRALTMLEAAVQADSTGTHLLSIYNSFSEAYLFMDSLDRALFYADLCCKVPNPRPAYLAGFYTTNAKLHMLRGNLDSAQILTFKAMDLFKTLTTGAENRLRGFTILAEIAQKKGNPGKAEQYYRQGLAEAKANFKNKNREIAYLLADAGVFYQKRGQLARALECFQSALIQCFPTFNDPDSRQNPTLEAIPLESQALRAALGKAQVLLKISAKSAEAEARRKNAAYCFDLAFAVAARLRQTYGNDADKLAQAASLRKDYQLAVLNLNSLYISSGDQLYLERLFSLIEQTKAQALTDALQQQRALALAGIPAEMLEKESHLRLELAAYTQTLAEAELAKDSARIADLKKQDRNPSKKYDGFLIDLQKRYPQFRKYQEAGVSTDFLSVSRALPDSTALLSWFDTGERYLLLGVFRGKLYYDHVMRDTEFDRRIAGFIALTADLNKQQTDPATFFKEAAFLGESLLPSFWVEARKLVIVPDGLLCYLPFEVLLTAPQAPGDYSSAPYLLRRCAVDYLWTAKLLVTPPLELHTRGLVHFAPFASAEPRNLPMLSHSLADVPERIGADRLEGVAASSTAFVRHASQFQTIHLSTHAHAGRAGEPGIEFFDRRFPMQEVYAQRLRASLVCLSACETGVGVFTDGEGVLSLARAFAYAGAQSLVAGLWQVDDQSTAAIFAAFYENLKRGMPKSEALRQAKLAQLDAVGSDVQKAPYYWAAFTFNGTDGVVDVSEKWTALWYWMLGGVILSLILFWGWRGRPRWNKFKK